jgi:sterol desaturase/sphingolipid hydroxylase (fatty acid hydroxylase superfamily)
MVKQMLFGVSRISWATLLRRGLIPIGLLVTLAVVIAVASTNSAHPRVLGIASGAVLGGLTLLELLAGRWHPGLRTLARDITAFVLASGIATGAATLLGLLVDIRGTGFGPLGALPLPLAIPLAIVMSDGLAYAIHRAAHTHPLLWRMHAAHHLPDRLYALVAVVEGPLIIFAMRFLRPGLLWMLGFPASVVFAHAMFDLWQGLSSHTGIDTDNPWLSRVVQTPQVHRLHHSSDPAHAGNYGLLLTIWDRVFGTFVGPEHTITTLGLPSDSPLPRSWWRALLLLPAPADASTRRLGP